MKLFFDILGIHLFHLNSIEATLFKDFGLLKC